jgi:hypothetical protein
MRVKMKVDMSGTRDGVPWPPRGTPIDLPEAEALQYLNADMAVPAGEEPPQTATMPTDDVETRGPVTTRTGPVKKTNK